MGAWIFAACAAFGWAVSYLVEYVQDLLDPTLSPRKHP